MVNGIYLQMGVLMARRQRFRWVNSVVVALSRVASGEVDEAWVRGGGCE